MKFLITSMIMFLTLLIININIQTINGLKNRMKFTSQLDNLKDKYKEKILYGEMKQSNVMNDTTIVETLENKIKTIYKKLNLNSEELIHLKKITPNVDEYIVFLKILIDKLSTLRKLEKNIKQINGINDAFYKDKINKNQNKRENKNHTKLNVLENKVEQNLNKCSFNNETLINHSSIEKSQFFEIKNERNSTKNFRRNRTIVKSKMSLINPDNIISLKSNCSEKEKKKTFKNDSISRINKLTNNKLSYEKGPFILNKEDWEFLNKFNSLNLKRHGFKYKFTDLISELIKFKIWKLNNHLKLKPIVNKGDNLNYFQKSEKNLNIQNLTNLVPDRNKSNIHNVTKSNLSPQIHNEVLSKNKKDILVDQKLNNSENITRSCIDKLLKNKNMKEPYHNLENKNKTEDIIRKDIEKIKDIENEKLNRQNNTLFNNSDNNLTFENSNRRISNQSFSNLNNQSELIFGDRKDKCNSTLKINFNNLSNGDSTNKNKTRKKKIVEDSIPSIFDKLDGGDKEPSKMLKIDNVINFTLTKNKSNKTNHVNSNNNSNCDMSEDFFFDNYTDSEINNDLINKKINKEFNITHDNDFNNVYDNFSSPNFVLLNITDLDKLTTPKNSTKHNNNQSKLYEHETDIKKINLKLNNTKNNSILLRTKEHFPLSVLNNNDIFEDRNFELYLLNKKKQDKNNSYFSEMLKGNDLNDTEEENNYGEGENLHVMQLDDLSEKFKIYLENTKKQKQEFEKEEQNLKQNNGTLNQKSNVTVVSSLTPKIINLNIKNTEISKKKSVLNKNYTINNSTFDVQNNFDVNENKNKNLLKPRKLLIDNKISEVNKTNPSVASEIKSFYGDNFTAYAKTRKNLENEGKNFNISKGSNETKNDSADSVTKDDKNAKSNSKKNKNLKETKKTEGQMVNILFSLVLIGLLLAGLCWLIFLMFMKTNTK